MDEEKEDQFIIVTGNPIHGFEFFGPFPYEVAAIEWAERKFDDREWWTAFVNPTE